MVYMLKQKLKHSFFTKEIRKDAKALGKESYLSRWEGKGNIVSAGVTAFPVSKSNAEGLRLYPIGAKSAR